MTPADIRSVIANGGPEIVFQPIVSMLGHSPDHQVQGYEALSRFPGGLPPNLWFAAAYVEGLGHELEQAAIHNAIAIFRNHLGGFDDKLGYLAVNLSPKGLLNASLRHWLIEQERNIPVHLIVELSESQVVSDYESIIVAITELRRVGVALSIDDLGAGYSSLLHVMHLHPEYIKIDRLLADNVVKDEYQQHLVRIIVLMGLTTGAHVVVEGVETKEQANALRMLGVTSGQGWYYGYPGPLPESAPA